MMDEDIVKFILVNSGEDATKIGLESCVERKDTIRSRTPEVTLALAKSLTTLFCHKVSSAAHQRYLVRTKLIVRILANIYISIEQYLKCEQLRDWSRITNRYARLQTFTDGERTTKFAVNLVKKYLTKGFIQKQSSIDLLIKLAFALCDMKLKNPMFDYELDNIINQILCLDKTGENSVFSTFLIEEYENLSLNISTIENIYICRAKMLIEIPIVDFYVSYTENYRNDNSCLKTVENYLDSAMENPSHNLCKQLFKYASKSPQIFQLLSSVMCEILALKNCCQIVLNFIRFILDYISKLCDEEGNEILDLYPRNLQCAVILLRIDPDLHTNRTRNCTIKILKSLNGSNKQQLLILLTHFPLWLKEVSNFSSDIDNFR